jgi:hypothetical protein
MLDALLKNRRLWERPILDAWSIAHTLSGVLIAHVLILMGVNFWLGLVLSIAAASLWELFEKVTHLSDIEHSTNAFSDIVVAQIGYCAGAWIFIAYAGTGIDTVVAIISGIIFAVICVLGWLSHRWYGKK